MRSHGLWTTETSPETLQEHKEKQKAANIYIYIIHIYIYLYNYYINYICIYILDYQ